MDETELAWAAGFFDGEGSTIRRVVGSRIEAPFVGITQHGPDGVPEVLTRFQAAVGIAGRIYESARGKARHPGYRLVYGRQADTQAVIEAIWPWLGKVKRAQYETRRAEYLADLARRAPLHRRNRTHCPAGHPYDAANTYITKTGSRHCRACGRDRMNNRSREVRDATNARRRARRAAGLAEPAI